MPMRGTVRRARSAIAVDLRAFGWDRATIATLRHSTLPWIDGFAPSISLEATPLAEAGELGARDRLSLVAQFAAHQALLHFAGFSDAEHDPDEWAVVRKRGTDCRLVRVSARPAGDEAPPALTVIQQFAESIEAPALDTLRQSWGRAESVYLEIDARLRGDAAADLRWMRGAAWGEIASPGPEALNEILRGKTRSFRGDAVDSIRAAAALGGERVFEIGPDASPLQRYSAIRALAEITQLDKESEIAERVVDAASRQRLIFCVTNRERFDSAAARVIEMLEAAGAGVWIAADRGDVDLPPSRFFVVAPFLSARRELEERIESRDWLEAFIASDAFPRFLDAGTVPAGDHAPALASLREPLRSYIAAIALLGTRVHIDVAAAFFRQLMFGEGVEDLVVDGITSIDDGHLVFASEGVRNAARGLIPQSSQPTLCRVAAEVLSERDLAAAASLLIDAGDPRAAAALLERASVSEALPVLREMPRHALTPKLAETLARALIDGGRYRDARDVAHIVTGEAREFLLAKIERRMGDYGPALARLDRMTAPPFEAELLRADLLYLESRYDDMREALAVCAPATDEDRAQLAYQRALLACEIGAASEERLPADHYLEARLATYLALSRNDLDAAANHAATSLDRARCVAERIDAALDRIFILFTSGAWPEARDEALHTLALVEETQGDRAAGGILFILTYLAADDGQWAHATQRLHRLRHFFRGTGDERRLRELDLLSAHLDFSRGRFAEAARAAQAILEMDVSTQIREAAALILDEIDWIEGRQTPLRSNGKSGNAELTNRYAAIRIRRDGGNADVGEQKLKRFRDALGRGLNDVAQSLAAEMKIDIPRRETSASALELRFLRDAAMREFPFTARDFVPTPWRFATRNRLGQWQEIGSLPPIAAAELDVIAAAGGTDWIVCSDRELLFVDGISRWSHESRDALAALFRTRAEHHRMRRVIEQNESVTVAKSEAIDGAVDGIVGDSPAMREIFTLITRVARRDVPVCILGESGTGKELVARAMHRHSPRRGKTFTPVNCAALPENLIESELFGHVRGAFTGADRDRAGLIETSDGGTLFLDEIGEMPLAAQAKLLRFLQEGEFRRVGDTVNRSADVRIVSATNRKLESAVEDGRFREDLYYRIGGIEIALPPLRDRATDVPTLAAYFLAKEREKSRGGPSKLTADAESVFLSYRWPGNVRELQNTIRAAHALAGEVSAIDVEHLPERMRSAVVRGGGSISSYQDAVTRFRRELIEKSLVQANGNQNRAAASLNMSRQALAYQIRELGILVRAK
jgi:DNA-binding NtrC family response regulator